MKVPTWIALLMLIIALSLGMAFNFYNHAINTQTKLIYAPQNVQVVNISSYQAAISWQTDQATVSQIKASTKSQTLNQLRDDRDSITKNSPAQSLTHFVTLSNLIPDQTYRYSISTGSYDYPQVSFKTLPNPANSNEASNSTQPVHGVVVSHDLKPVTDGLVYLNIPGVQKLGGFINFTGNFLIPLNNLKTANFNQSYTLASKTPATLLVKTPSSTTEFKIFLPVGSLPVLQIGTNQNLIEYLESSSSAQILKKPKRPLAQKPANPFVNKFDLNADYKVNVIDLAIVLQNFGSNPKDKRVDFNLDGKVDQDDIGLIKASLQ